MDDTTVYVYLKPHLYDKIFIVYFTHVNFLITCAILSYELIFSCKFYIAD